jgi:hypothetical protein
MKADVVIRVDMVKKGRDELVGTESELVNDTPELVNEE